MDVRVSVLFVVGFVAGHEEGEVPERWGNVSAAEVDPTGAWQAGGER